MIWIQIVAILVFVGIVAGIIVYQFGWGKDIKEFVSIVFWFTILMLVALYFWAVDNLERLYCKIKRKIYNP